MVSRTAECACGALKATVAGEPTLVLACNCTQCQKRTGSIFGVSAYFSKQTVNISGKSKAFTSVSDRGTRSSDHFCPECGTTLFWDAGALPDMRGVAVGCFADPSFPPPQFVIWAQHKHHWARFPEGVPIYKQGRGTTNE
jgi:hypothetical protein